MISRALRGKCPLLFYSQGKTRGKSATRKSPRGRVAIRVAPPCCPCLVPCAFAPVTTTQRQSLEKLGHDLSRHLVQVFPPRLAAN